MELCMEEIDIPLAFILISLPFIGIEAGNCTKSKATIELTSKHPKYFEIARTESLQK